MKTRRRPHHPFIARDSDQSRRRQTAPTWSTAGTILRRFHPALAALWLLGTSAFAAPEFSESALFVSGQDGYHTYRIPALAVTNAGTLLAICEGRKSSSSDSGNIDLLVKRSTDNGATWSARQIIWSDGGNTCGNPCVVVDRSTGTICLLSTWNRGEDRESKIINGTSIDTRRVYLISSTDDGLTWSAAQDITATTKQAGWSWYATGPGHGVQLQRGRQAGRLIIPCDHITTSGKAFGSHVIFSDDYGANWQIGAVADTTATVRPNENECVELVAPAAGGGSRLYFNARDHQGPHSRASTWSEDGGGSYTPTTFSDATAFTCPTVQGSLVRFRATDTGDPTNRILFACSNGGSRTRISLWSSSDETATWSAPKLVHEGASAYSDMVRTPDGKVALFYEKGSRSPYETITLARFNEEWLDAPPAENPDAAPGTTIPTAADVSSTHPVLRTRDVPKRP